MRSLAPAKHTNKPPSYEYDAFRPRRCEGNVFSICKATLVCLNISSCVRKHFFLHNCSSKIQKWDFFNFCHLSDILKITFIPQPNKAMNIKTTSIVYCHIRLSIYSVWCIHIMTIKRFSNNLFAERIQIKSFATFGGFFFKVEVH